MLNDPECPDILIHRALTLYDPLEVLKVPNISIRYLFLEDKFLKDCFNINRDIKIRALNYNTTFERTVLFYVQSILTELPFIRYCCLMFLRNKKYLKKFLKLNPNFLDELINEDSESSIARLKVAYYFCIKKLISYEDLLKLVQNIKKDYILTNYKDYFSYYGFGDIFIKNLLTDSHLLSKSEKAFLIQEIYNIYMVSNNTHFYKDILKRDIIDLIKYFDPKLVREMQW